MSLQHHFKNESLDFFCPNSGSTLPKEFSFLNQSSENIKLKLFVFYEVLCIRHLKMWVAFMHAMKDVLGLWSILNLRMGFPIQLSLSNFLLHFVCQSWNINAHPSGRISQWFSFQTSTKWYFVQCGSSNVFLSCLSMRPFLSIRHVAKCYVIHKKVKFTRIYQKDKHTFCKEKAGLVPLSYIQLVAWQD